MAAHHTVERVFVKNFRSLPSQRVELSSPTVLVGGNGSGKSNFVDVFSFLAEAAAQPLQAVFDRRGGVSAVRHQKPRDTERSLGLGVDLANLEAAEIEEGIESAHYAFEVREVGELEVELVREQCVVNLVRGRRFWFDRQAESFRTNVEWLSDARGRWFSPNSLAISALGSISPFRAVSSALNGMKVYSIEPEAMGGMRDADSGVNLRPDGSNAASVLDEIKRRAPQDYARIVEILLAVTPGIDEVRPSRYGKQAGLDFVQRWSNNNELVFDAFSMSNGTLRALGLLLAVYQRTRPTLMAIEEPEASLHPGAVNTILDLLRHLSTRMNVIVTTHSPEVLDTEWLSDEHIRYITWSEGFSTVADLSESSRASIRKHLMGAGELLRANSLEPTPLFVDTRTIQLFVGIE